MIKVAMIEDNSRYRADISALLNADEGFDCVGVYGSAEEGLRKLGKNLPEVLLMDIHLPGATGIECAAKVKAAFPQVQILVLTVYEDTDSIFRALQAGASGYLLKRAHPDEIIDAIRAVKEGGAPMTNQIARKVVESFRARPGVVTTGTPLESLSKREEEILDFLAKGYQTKEIAAQLSVSVNTIRSHLQRIYEKLHVRSRTEAVIKYLG
jgi:DNA-binding NarL/FixJ family response regulator